MEVIDSIHLALMSEKGGLFILWIPIQAEGKYLFSSADGNEDIDFLSIEAIAGEWYVLCKKESYISYTNDSIGKVHSMKLINKQLALIRYKKADYILYIENYNKESKIFRNYYASDRSEILIGRTNGNHICYPNYCVSRYHAKILYMNKNWYITDLNSANGTFVNNRRIGANKIVRLYIGDCIYIMGLKILIGIGFLSINDGNHRVILNQAVLNKSPYRTDHNMSVKREDVLFNRLPRDVQKYDIKPVTIEAPPLSLNSDRIPLMLRMGGSMVMGGSAMLAGNYTSILSMVLFPVLNQKYTEKQKKEYEKRRVEKYTQYLQDKKTEIKKEKLYEEHNLRMLYPDINTILTYPIDKKKLWERGKNEEDFLSLRLGYGEIPLLADINYPEKRFNLDEDILEKEMYNLAEKPVWLENVPIMLPLIENYVSSVTGNRKDRLELLKRIILQIVFLHSYDEAKIVLLTENDILKQIPEVRYLPHVWNDERDFRFIATDLATGYLIGEYLNKQLEMDAERPRELKEILRERPYYIILAWSKRIFDAIEILKTIEQSEKNMGVSVITFFDEIPQLTQEIIYLHSDYKNRIQYLKKNEYPGKAFFMDGVDTKTAKKMLKVISNTKLKVLNSVYALPKMITFLEMYGVGKVEHLNPLKRWRENNPMKSLAVPIGVATDGTYFILDLHEKYQGPHGLVAGMTGSGKSEFIITYILSLAVNFHPDEVAFVLIDYKGGGLAGAFEDEERGIHLPHLVGTITNLDGSAIQRSLMSIKSELKRRQKIFNEAKSITNEGTMDIYTYQKLYRSGKVTQPLPHLFLISDEFAELKSQEPEFMDQLISAARIGRSLGVHLILATQKPAGVVNDQISSNAKFRVCLKVQTRADSDEMLRRPEAAELKETGRFYLQVGYNEYFALGQSAWCGAEYEPQDEVIVHRDDSVQFIDDAGQNIIQVRPAPSKISSGVSQLVAIVKYLSDLAEKEQIEKRKLWKKPLPEIISIKELQQKYFVHRPGRIKTVIGMVDDPENQKQFPFEFDFLKCENLLMIGSNQYGNTMVLQTMLYSLISNYTPEDIQYYILDYSSHTFDIFDSIPFCGGVWGDEDEKGTQQFFKLLDEIIAERKQKFQNAQVSHFESYLEIKKMPLILVVIDNIAGLSQWKEGQSIYYDFNMLIREANAVGIKFLITAGNIDDILYKIKKELNDRLVFSAKNKFEYGDILNVKCRYEPVQIAGRGLCRMDDRSLEIQIAKYHIDGTEQQRIQALKEEILELNKNFENGIKARRILKLSKSETYETFCEDILPERIPLGYSVFDLKKISMPLKQLYCMAVYWGNPKGMVPVLNNFLYAAKRDNMHLLIMKRNQSSVFEKDCIKKTLELIPEVSFLKNTEEDSTKLWKEILQDEINYRKKYRNAYCEKHHLSTSDSSSMKFCSNYIRSRTYPLWIIFENFAEFCDQAESLALKMIENIFINGKGYNFYFMGCFYPDDTSMMSVKSIYKIFNREGFTLLYGGQFHRQGLVSLPMKYQNIQKPSKKMNSFLMQYKDEVYPLWMPCRPIEDKRIDFDDEDII